MARGFREEMCPRGPARSHRLPSGLASAKFPSRPAAGAPDLDDAGDMGTPREGKAMSTAEAREVEIRTVRRIAIRLVPFLVLCYFVAYLDRVNVSFAKLTMNQALGFSEAAFGLGAGLFFIAYFLFEVPSNIFLERVGARVWIARIMISWGIVSAAFAFIPSISGATGTSNETVFYTFRLLLGACEAGFFPGIIFYLTLWFPAVYRARVVSFFMLAIPISSIVGSPISGMLLSFTGWGLAGWQWLFILEALPSVLVGLCVLVYLTDFPRQARWLQEDEIEWLENVQAREKSN